MTVQCIRDGQFVLVVAKDVTLPRLSLDTIHLLGGSEAPCGPVGSTPSFAIYQFPVTACGTSMMVSLMICVSRTNFMLIMFPFVGGPWLCGI